MGAAAKAAACDGRPDVVQVTSLTMCNYNSNGGIERVGGGIFDLPSRAQSLYLPFFIVGAGVLPAACSREVCCRSSKTLSRSSVTGLLRYRSRYAAAPSHCATRLCSSKLVLMLHNSGSLQQQLPWLKRSSSLVLHLFQLFERSGSSSQGGCCRRFYRGMSL